MEENKDIGMMRTKKVLIKNVRCLNSQFPFRARYIRTGTVYPANSLNEGDDLEIASRSLIHLGSEAYLLNWKANVILNCTVNDPGHLYQRNFSF